MSLWSDLQADWANVEATIASWFTALEPIAQQELALIWGDVTTWAETEANVVLADLQAGMPAFVAALEAYAVQLLADIEAYFPAVVSLAATPKAARGATAPYVAAMPQALTSDVQAAWVAAGLWKGACTTVTLAGHQIPLSPASCHSITARITTNYIANK